MKKRKQNSGSPAPVLARQNNSSPLQHADLGVLFSQAFAMHQAGNLDGAEMFYQIILASDPLHVDALTLMGTLHLQRSRLEQGVHMLSASLGINPRQVMALNNLGNGLKDLQRYDEALASYGRAIAINPDYADAYFNRGVMLQELKRYGQALDSYDHAIAARPDFAEAYNNRGTVLKELQQNGEALASYERAIALASGYAEAHNNRGVALKDAGRFEEALASCDTAIALNPDYAEAYSNRGIVLQKLGRSEEALACYDRAALSRPDYAEAHYNRGCVLSDLQRYEDALTAYGKAIALTPGHADAHYNRGNALCNLQRYDEALASYGQAVNIKPDYVDVHLKRGIVLQSQERYDEALDAYDHAIAAAPEFGEAHKHRGSVLMKLQRHEEALAACDRALALGSSYADAHYNRGAALNRLGGAAEAILSLHEAIKLNPGHVMAYYELVYMRTFTPDDDVFKQLELLYSRRAALPSDDRVNLGFAMGKALENQGRYDDAFAAYEEANRLHHQEHPFDEAAEDTWLEGNIALYAKNVFEEERRSLGYLPPLPDDRVPVFIVGMPRSGTTLLEQVLASHPGLFAAGELSVVSDIVRERLPSLSNSPGKDALLTLGDLGKEYLDRVWRLAPQARFITDKLPGNYRHLGLLHIMLPNAKIIHSMRDPMDSCFSCFALRFEEAHDYAYDLGTLGRHYRRYIQLMRHWHSVLPPGTILDVRYEDMVADPEREARRVLEYLGLPWDPSCLKFHENKRAISTASVSQVRKPIYSSSIARWKHFEKHLAPLLDIVSGYR